MSMVEVLMLSIVFFISRFISRFIVELLKEKKIFPFNEKEGT